ncbi:hypothetical protein BAR24066_04386 [Burkholderia arboris]|uniref:Uncharacterized protein n=1 Tax=Burkholderia arboris TaxID=488730 RepID=A0A9Q9USJ3_9BURK|nr:hypothetical protein BAR24066_04386 [Burkholderia arboris]
MALEYGLDRITFYDNTGEGKMSVPSATVDWMRARMPFLN